MKFVSIILATGLVFFGSLVATMFGLTSSAAHAADVTFSGSAYYRERIALPGNAALVVELINLAKPNTVLGETKVEPAGQVPITFSLIVDSRQLPAGHAYALNARINVDGAAWFANNKPLRVRPAKAGKDGLSLQLVRVTDKAAVASPLGGDRLAACGAGPQEYRSRRSLDTCR